MEQFGNTLSFDFFNNQFDSGVLSMVRRGLRSKEKSGDISKKEIRFAVRIDKARARAGEIHITPQPLSISPKEARLAVSAMNLAVAERENERGSDVLCRQVEVALPKIEGFAK